MFSKSFLVACWLFLGLFVAANFSAASSFSLEWDSLTTQEKIEALTDGDAFFETERSFDFEKVRSRALRAEIKRVVPEILNNINVEEIDVDLDMMPSTFTVGPLHMVPEVTLRTVRAGFWLVQFYVRQDGGATFDRKTAPPKKHYSVVEEAELVGLDINADVSWSAFPVYEFDGKKLTLLTYSLWSPLGLSWSGW